MGVYVKTATITQERKRRITNDYLKRVAPNIALLLPNIKGMVYLSMMLNIQGP